MIMTMVGEESLEVYLEFSLVILLKSYCLKESRVLHLAHEIGAVDTAEVDKVQRTSAHNEHCLEIFKIKRGGEVVYKTAVRGHLELANARKAVIYCGGIRQRVGIVFHSALMTYLLLSYL